MPNTNELPEILQNFRVYESGGNDLKGVVDVTLPSLESLTESVKGAGIAGEYETPVVGHYKSMTVSLKYRTATAGLLALSAPKIHALDLRGAIQSRDDASGTLRTVPMRVAVRCSPKKTEPGKFEVGAGMDASNEFECTYLKITLDGKDMVEIDKLNYKCVIDGTDYLSEIRSALGM